jgi:hypothetical protein
MVKIFRQSTGSNPSLLSRKLEAAGLASLPSLESHLSSFSCSIFYVRWTLESGTQKLGFHRRSTRGYA